MTGSESTGGGAMVGRSAEGEATSGELAARELTAGELLGAETGSFILLVDDSPQNRYVLRRILEHNNFAVKEAATGMQALGMVNQQPDLVILDVKLPDVSGFEVCRRIKSNPDTSTIPVLQVSAAFVSTESKVMALEGGADGYLVHPIDSIVLVATVRSLLRLRQAETLSRHSAQQWQSIFDSLTEGLVLVDLDGRIVRCNRAFSEMCSVPFADAIGKDARQVLGPVLGEEGTLGTSLTRRVNFEREYGDRWFRITENPVMSGKGSIGLAVVLEDITERRHAEEALRYSEKLAAMGRLAHTIAHEINNPLEALVNLVYLARHTELSPAAAGYLKSANEELERVARITKQVLSFHRETDHPVPMDISSVMETVVEMYGPKAFSKQVTLSVDMRTTEQICGFPGELRQVLSNLVGNAVDAAPVGGWVKVRVGRLTVRGKRMVRVTVHDNGTGIPQEITEHIFEPFFTTKELKGSGLGLWLVRNIVAKHEGVMRFKSRTSGRRIGTCFQLLLPSEQQENTPNEARCR